MIRSISRHAIVMISLAVLGCDSYKVEKPARVEQPSLPPKEVADFLKGTVLQYSDLMDTQPQHVSGFGLVVNLSGTGDTRVPEKVLTYMRSQMEKHGFGNPNVPGFEKLGPSTVLQDPLNRTSIVRVDGYIPAGARKGQPFDVQVSVMENNNTTSLHRGMLYSTDLAENGADPFNPTSASIRKKAQASGYILVNPLAALSESPTDAQKLSLKYGILMSRGVTTQDRGMTIRLRTPEARIAKAIELRIKERFQDTSTPGTTRESIIATMVTDSEVRIFVPPTFKTDAARFAGVVTHLYLTPSNDTARIKARELAELAQRDREKAPLLDISYCWEAMGTVALSEIRPLYTSDSPDVAYAAARAGAYVGDLTATEALIGIARTKDNPFQIEAVRVLGDLPRTTRISGLLRELIDTDQNLLRIEAYKAMIASEDGTIISEPIEDKFILDIVPSRGPSLIYASRAGTPRIAVIGGKMAIKTPVTFLSMAGKFSISSGTGMKGLQLFYRGEETMPAVNLQSQSDLSIVIARLGGAGAAKDKNRFGFSYGDVVGLLNQLSEQKLLVSGEENQSNDVAFMLQAFPGVEDPILSAKPIPESDDQRPTTVPSADAPVSTNTEGQRPLN